MAEKRNGKGIIMDVRYLKRVTVTCPCCHKELAFNGQKLHEKKKELQLDYARITEKLRSRKIRDGYYKDLIRQQAEVLAALKDVKNQIDAASNITEKEVYEAFKQRMYQKLGREETLKILQECEEELIAGKDSVTRYTRFENAGTSTTGKRFS